MLKVKTVRRAALAVTTAFAASGAIGLHAAQAPDPQPWIHLDMTGEQANMNLNLPLTAIEAALALAPEAIVDRDGQLQLGGEREIPVAAIREVWNQMRGAGDIEFANIQDGRQSIRVAREGDTIVVNVTGTDDDDAESGPDAESGRDAGQDRADAGRGARASSRAMDSSRAGIPILRACLRSAATSPTMRGAHLFRTRASRTAFRHTSGPTPAGSPMVIAMTGRPFTAAPSLPSPPRLRERIGGNP